MSSQILRYKTQWATQFYAAAELTRRDYLVSLTFGNATKTDLLVQSKTGKKFSVDVKGLATKGFWLFRPHEPDPEHFFILVLMPPLPATPTFYVLSSDQMMKHRAEYAAAMTPGGRYQDKLGGMNWTTALPYKDNWDVLPN